MGNPLESDHDRLVRIDTTLDHLMKLLNGYVKEQKEIVVKVDECIQDVRAEFLDLTSVKKSIKDTKDLVEDNETRIENVERISLTNALQLKWSIRIVSFLLTPVYGAIVYLVIDKLKP